MTDNNTPAGKEEIIDTTLRDKLAKDEGSPYHETSAAREMAFKNGWDACFNNEPTGSLVKRFGELVVLKTKQAARISELEKECERLRELLEIQVGVTALAMMPETSDAELQFYWQQFKKDNHI